jgi:hypothetical protein
MRAGLTVEELSNETSADLCQEYQKYKAELKAEQESFDMAEAYYKSEMQKIAGALAIKLNAEGLQNIRTEHGTAYFSTLKRVKVVNRDDWFRRVWGDGAWDCLTAAVSKEAFLEKYPNGTDGVEIEETRNIHVRRS